MKNLFPGHYKPSEEEFQKLWAECIFVFDTNILLNVYRYSEKTRERLFEILGLLQDRIWLPYQVAYEYQEERLTGLKQKLSPNKPQTSFVSSKYVIVLIEPLNKTIRHGGTKC